MDADANKILDAIQPENETLNTRREPRGVNHQESLAAPFLGWFGFFWPDFIQSHFTVISWTLTAIKERLLFFTENTDNLIKY